MVRRPVGAWGGVRFPTGTPGLLRVGCQTPQARVSYLQARFQSFGAFQPLRSNDHRFGLQPGSTHQPHRGQHHRLRTLARLASKHQPLPRGHAVVEVSGSPVRPTAPACTEPGRVPHLGHPLHRRRLRCHHAHRLRVSRLLLARLFPLSSPTPGNPRQVIGPDHGGCLSHHPGQNPVSERSRIHGGGDVGMRLAPATTGPAPGGRLRGVPAPPTPSAASRGVLWRTHRRGAIESHRRPRGRDPLLRLHQSLPLGEQERPLPRWAHELIYAPDTVDHHPFFGLAKCTLLPPLGLYHPVLPYRTGDKLTFPLCRNCVENQLDRPLKAKTWQYPQTNQQRALTGTWCTPDLDKAVEQRYVVLNPLKIPLWPTTATFAPIHRLLPETNLFARIQLLLPKYNNFARIQHHLPEYNPFARIQPLLHKYNHFARIQPLLPDYKYFSRKQQFARIHPLLPEYNYFRPITTTLPEYNDF